jgi:predicted transcriptional regulator
LYERYSASLSAAADRYTVSEISRKLNMPLSTLSAHIKLLEDASLAFVVQNSATRGREKLVSRGINHVNIDLEPHIESQNKSAAFSIPLGSYTDCRVEASCGLADENGIVINDDTPSAFYAPERVHAQLLWFSAAGSFVEYRLPNHMLRDKDLTGIMLSCELCSECPNFNVDWRSDITFWINGTEICTYDCPGDMGGRQGKLSPQNWSLLATQFGFLKNIIVDREGAYLDQYRVSALKISQLDLASGDFIRIKIGIKDSAKHAGGVNLFGEKFGDFPQGLMIKIDWQD